MLLEAVDLKPIENKQAKGGRFLTGALGGAVLLAFTASPTLADSFSNIPGAVVVGTSLPGVVVIQQTTSCGLDSRFAHLVSEAPQLGTIRECTSFINGSGDVEQDLTGGSCFVNHINGIVACTDGSETIEDNPSTGTAVKRPNSALFPWEVGTQVVVPTQIVQAIPANVVTQPVEVIGIVQPGQQVITLAQPSTVLLNGIPTTVAAGQPIEVNNNNNNNNINRGFRR